MDIIDVAIYNCDFKEFKRLVDSENVDINKVLLKTGNNLKMIKYLIQRE